MPKKTGNTNASLEVSDQAEYMRYLKEADIADFAKYAGIDINEAVQRRVDNAVDETYTTLSKTQASIEVTARPITPIKNLVGFATVKFNDNFVVEDFKILQNEKGIFVGMPSKPDKNSEKGYRDTAKPITAAFRTELTEAVTEAYHAAVEKLQNRAANVTPPQSIKEQLADGAKQAAKGNANRPAPTKTTPNAER